MSAILILCAKLVKRFEGFCADPYLCPAGVWTVGYGTALRGSNGGFLTSHHPSPAITMTEDQAESEVQRYLADMVPKVERLFSAHLNDCQFAALLDFAYNLGLGNLQASTLRKVINRGDLGDVPRQFRRWIYAGGQKLAGLARRREAEIQLWQTDF